MEALKDALKIIGLLLCIMPFTMLVIMLPMWPLSAYFCHKEWHESGFEERFSLSTGCQIKTGHGWIPAEKYREVRS